MGFISDVLKITKRGATGTTKKDTFVNDSSYRNAVTKKKQNRDQFVDSKGRTKEQAEWEKYAEEQRRKDDELRAQREQEHNAMLEDLRRQQEEQQEYFRQQQAKNDQYVKDQQAIHDQYQQRAAQQKAADEAYDSMWSKDYMEQQRKQHEQYVKDQQAIHDSYAQQAAARKAADDAYDAMWSKDYMEQQRKQHDQQVQDQKTLHDYYARQAAAKKAADDAYDAMWSKDYMDEQRRMDDERTEQRRMENEAARKQMEWKQYLAQLGNAGKDEKALMRAENAYLSAADSERKLAGEGTDEELPRGTAFGPNDLQTAYGLGQKQIDADRQKRAEAQGLLGYEGIKKNSTDESGKFTYTVADQKRIQAERDKARAAGYYDGSIDPSMLSDEALALFPEAMQAEADKKQKSAEQMAADFEARTATKAWEEAYDFIDKIELRTKGASRAERVGRRKDNIENADNYFRYSFDQDVFMLQDDPQVMREALYNDLMYGRTSYAEITANMTPEEKTQLDGMLDNVLEEAFKNYGTWDPQREGQYEGLIKESWAYGGKIAEAQQEQENRQKIKSFSELAATAPTNGDYDPELRPEPKLTYNSSADTYIYEPQGTELEKAYFSMNEYTDDDEQGYGHVVNKYVFASDEQKLLFNRLYKWDKQNGTNYAGAYLEGLDNYLQAMLSEYQDTVIRMQAEDPVLGTANRILSYPENVIGGFAGLAGTGAALLGVDSAKDKNSSWYLTSKMVRTTREQQNENLDKWAVDTFGDWAKGKAKFLANVVDSIGDNLFAMGTANLMTGNVASNAGMRLVQLIMSGEATSNTMLEKLDAGMDPTEAALYSIGDGVIEWITEKWSLEALLKPDVKAMLGNKKQLAAFLAKTAAAEGSEEIASDLLNIGLDKVLSNIYGHEDELKKRYDELVVGGMTDTEATRAVLHEKFNEVAMSGLAGAISGGIMGGGRVVSNTITQNRMGRNINQVNSYTDQNGTNQLIEKAKALGGESQSARMAAELEEKISKGQKISDKTLGKLAQNIQMESQEQAASKEKEILQEAAEKELRDKGFKAQEAKDMAELIVRQQTEGVDSLSRKERMMLQESPTANQVIKDLNGETELSERVSKEIGEQTKVYDDAAQAATNLMRGRTAEGIDVRTVGKQLATQDEIDRAEGKQTKSPREVIVDREFGELEGMARGRMEDGKFVPAEDGAEPNRDDVWKYAVKVNGKTKYVDATDIKGTNFSTAAVIRDQAMDPYVYSGRYTNLLIDQIEKGNIQNVGRYLSDAYRIRWAAYTNKDMPQTGIAEEAAREIYRLSQMDKIDERKVQKEQANFKGAGNGTATFKNTEYGTQEFEDAIRDLDQETQDRIRFVADWAKTYGIDIQFADLNDTKNPWMHGSESSKGIMLNLESYDNKANQAKGIKHNIVATLGHEATHWLQRNNAAAYYELEEFVLNKMQAEGYDVAQRAQEIMESRRKHGQNISMTQAIDEIVANACDQVLGNPETVNELKKQHGKLYTKLKEYVNRLIDRIKSVTADLGESASIDAQRIMYKYGNELAKLWNGAMDEVLEGKIRQLDEAPAAASVAENFSMAEMDDQYDAAVKSGNVAEQQKLVYAAGAKNGYTIKAYHGTGRADRVGTVFRPERATSGPMAYFTDNREIASNYARDKKDTSIAYDEDYDDYHTQFRVTIKGKDVPVSKLWNTLSFSDRQKITEKAKHITLDDEAENIIYDPDAQYGIGNFNDYERKLHGWNSIETLIDGWLDGGTLFDREADFLQVLKLAGIEGVTYKDPNYREEKVYDTLLKIQHPFDVAKEYTGKFLEDLKEWWNNQDQEQYQKESAGADFWDKNGITVDEWIDYGFEDVERGSSNNWTRIPDGVTAYLKEKGYDGIKDNGGKGGGMGHTVWIPFSGEQVKSADPVTYDDAGKVIPLSERFNEKDNDIRWSMAEMEKEYDKYANDTIEYLKKNGKRKPGRPGFVSRLIKETAEKNGYKDKAYHGTMLFGFTEFDKKAGQDVIFVAYDEPLARTYTRSNGGNIREILTRKGVPQNHYVMSDKDLMDYYVSLHDNKFTNILSIERMDDNGTQSPVDKFEYVYQDNIFNEINTSVLRRFEMWQHIENATNANGELNGIYELYTKPGKQLVVDADGKNWNEIPFDTRNAELTIDKNDQYYYEPEDLERFEELGLDTPSVNTRELAQWAKDHGYDSVRINNVWDDGGRNSDVAWEDRNGDIGIFFNPADVKSADDIVLDDNGKVIPLSERFNDKKTDIRWSMAEEVNDGTQFAMADENAADIGVWMMSLTPSSVHTEGERALIQEYRGLKTTIDLTRKKLIDYRDQLKRLQKKGGMLTTDERDTVAELEARIQTNEEKMARLEQELYEVTRGEGYAAMMYRNSQIYKDHIEGKSQIQVEAAVDQLMSEVEDANKEIGVRQKVLNRMSEESAVKTVRRELRNRGLKQNAAALKDGYFTTMSNAELEARLAEIVVKAVNGEEAESIKTAIDSLAADIVNSPVSRMAEDAQDALRPLKGRTVTFGPSEQAELKAIGYTLAEIRSMTKGSGITFKFGENSTLQGDLEEIAKEAPAIRDELMDKSTSAEQAAVVLVDWVAGKMKDMKGNPKDFNFDTKEVSFVVLACMQQMLNENQGGMTRAALRKRIDTAAGEIGKMADAVNSLMETVQKIRQNAIKASNAAGGLRGDMAAAVDYYNLIARQAAEVERARVKRDVIEKLRSENTKKLIEQQQKYQEMMKKDRRARELQKDNESLRKVITTDAKRLKDRLVAETDQKNIPEEAKPLARQLVSMLVNHDMAGWRRVLNADKKMLADVQMRLDKMEAAGSKFDIDTDLDWLVIQAPNAEDNDTSIKEAVQNDLVKIEQGLLEYRNAEGQGNVSLQDRKNALEKIQEAVSEIYDVIRARETAFIQGQKVKVQDLATRLERDMRNSRFKGERTGKLGAMVDKIAHAVSFGNLTPEYFIKMLRNPTMTLMYKGMHDAENRSGLETQEAQERIEKIAEETGYATWDGQEKHKVKLLNGRTIEMSTEQLMALYATWNREKNQIRPEDTAHLLKGGFVLAKGDTKQGVYGREKTQQRPIRMTEEDLNSIGSYLTDQQRDFVDRIVEYMSTDMAEIGNEASLQAYGIKKFTEKYYFPIKSWGGVLNQSSASGVNNQNENRAMRQSFTKRVMNNARNAIEIGDFTPTAMKHIVGMITFNTVGPAVENLNKVLNQQLEYYEDEEMDPDESYKRSMRAAFEEYYGKEALNYLKQFMQDVNGGVGRQQDTSVKEKLLSVFRKGAVSGSMSVALQQPLSYIRAAMMINPKYLTEAMSPTNWGKIHDEMLKYSGIAVIKDMGRFDMGQGQSMVDYITPEGLKSKGKKIAEAAGEKLTIVPEIMDRVTWGRIWVACKLEQAAQNKGMDTKSEEFLQKVAERFNDVMRRTQVYDSILVKSQNMRSKNYAVKSMTSFMAEPTLSLNVLADAVQNAKEKGGKETLAKAGATFLLSAVMQALVKAAMSSGRSPDKKKTWLEQFLTRWASNFISEANPFSLIPGYSDLMEVLRKGELTDDAISVLGKFKTIFEKTKELVEGKSNSTYRSIEDTAGQLAQIFTNVPVKNLMRDARAMYNFLNPDTYAKRETSSAIVKYGILDTLHDQDNLTGMINSWTSAYKSDTTSYINRLYQAMKSGDTQKAGDLKEYLLKVKMANGATPEKTLNQKLNALTKKDKSLSAEEKIEALDENGYGSMGSYVLEQLKTGKIDRKTAEEQYRKANPNRDEKKIATALDGAEWIRDGKDLAEGQKEYTNYTPLLTGLEHNSTEEIRKGIDNLTDAGYDAKNIKKQVNEQMKKQYLAADSKGRIQIRDAMQKAYKALGFTAEDADKTISSWTKEKK